LEELEVTASGYDDLFGDGDIELYFAIGSLGLNNYGSGGYGSTDNGRFDDTEILRYSRW
jgi:hypothetical protein